MKHILTILIDATNTNLPSNVRDEVADAVEDYIESYQPVGRIVVSDVEAIETSHHAALIALAQQTYGSDDIQFDVDARLSEGDEGTWVQGWLFLDNETLAGAGIADLPEAER